MSRAAIVCLIAALMVRAAKPPEVEVIAMKLHRDGDLILVDMTVKNTSPKTLKSLVAILRFYSVGHDFISSQRAAIDEVDLDSGEESDIHAQLSSPPRAVSVEFSAEANGARELRVQNAGPFSIE